MSEIEPQKHPGGRPTAYKPEYCEQGYKLCLLGATDAELADFFEVSESTVNLWKQKHPEFSESLARGKTIADAEVASKLHGRAVGYEFDEAVPIKKKSVRYENGKRLSEDEEIVTVTVKRIMPPDTQAATYWLNNRQSKNWKNKQEIDGKMKHTHVNNLSDDELDAEIKRYEQAAEGTVSAAAEGEGAA